MMETSARLLRLPSLLQTPRAWTGVELAERLEVSERTVRKDVERLRALGYPVDANRGSVGGYRLGAGASLPPLLLDDDEAVAVTIGLRRAAGITGVEEISLRALAKLEQVLPSRLRRRVNTISTYTQQVPYDSVGPTVDPSLLTDLASLCRGHERLRFDYRSHSGEATLRTVEPHRLVNWGRRWYLVAYDVDRQDWRTFRVDRVEPRIPTGPRFTPRELPESGDVAAYVSRRVSAAAWRYRARVVVHARADEIASFLPPAAGTIEPIDEHTCLVDTGADSIKTLALHLGLLEADFDVTGPPELIDYLTTLSTRYHQAVSPS